MSKPWEILFHPLSKNAVNCQKMNYRYGLVRYLSKLSIIVDCNPISF